MKILFLGATGYLGYNLVSCLQSDGHEIIPVVRQSDDCNRFKGMKCISNDMLQIDMLLKQEKIDWIINSIGVYKANNDNLYDDMISANMFFPLRVLNLAAKHGDINFMTMGTSLPKSLNIYSKTKAMLSDLARNYVENYNINFYDMQLEMFYGGVCEPLNRFIPSCIEKMVFNEVVDLTSGTQKRDLIHVEDIGRVIKGVISKHNKEYHKFYTLPVGTGVNYSIKEIMLFLKDVLESKSKLNFGAIESRRNEPDTLANISWYKKYDIHLKYDVFDGLKECCMKMKKSETSNIVKSTKQY